MSEAQIIQTSTAGQILQGSGQGAPQAEAREAIGGIQPEAPKAPTEGATNTEETDFSRKFAAISREEKRLLEERRRIKALQDEFRNQSQEFEAYKKRQELKKSNPFKWLQEEQVPMDQIVSGAISDTPSDEDLLIQKLEAKLEEKLQNKFKPIEEREKQAIVEAQKKQIDAFKSNIEDTIKANSEKYEIISSRGLTDQVFDVIYEKFNKDTEAKRAEGDDSPVQPMSIEEAADLVEKYYESQFKEFSQLKKFQPKPQTDAKPELPPKANTLNGNLTPAVTAPKSRFMSAEESRAEAAKLLKWS